jgi:hypothetical protein
MSAAVTTVCAVVAACCCCCQQLMAVSVGQKRGRETDELADDNAPKKKVRVQFFSALVSICGCPGLACS